tara:strand:- start:41 stop:208 length:168 start_codon:yes stop_codon:yes gene_type:complete
MSGATALTEYGIVVGEKQYGHVFSSVLWYLFFFDPSSLHMAQFAAPGCSIARAWW